MKGSMYAWIIITVLVFVVGFIWIILSQVYNGTLFPEFEDELMANEDTAQTFTYIKNTWAYWPVILIFGLILYGMISALRKEPYSQYS